MLMQSLVFLHLIFGLDLVWYLFTTIFGNVTVYPVILAVFGLLFNFDFIRDYT